jgi:cytochrome P450
VDLGAIDLTDLDRFAEGFPHEAFATLRAEAPVWWHEPTPHTPDGVGFWVVSRHREVLEVADDAVTFSSERAPGCPGGGTIIQDLPYGFGAGVLLNMMDDPRHHQIRRLCTPAVAPRALAEIEPDLRARACALLDAAAERGTCDFLTDVAVELPIQATCQLLGVPQEDRLELVRWTNSTLAYEGRELDESSAEADEASASMAGYARQIIERKRHRPGDDLLSRVVAAEVPRRDGDGPPAEERGEPLSDIELQMFFSLMVAAGSETTRNAIALGVAALIEHPDELAALRADPSLVPSAVEEILRWTSPTLYNRRTATRDSDVGGQRIAQGDKVTLWWTSADFDESVFEEPFRFDVRRSPNPHLAFGHRTHFCLGANLARLEIRIVLEELLARFDHLELPRPLRRVRTNKHAGVCSMPLSVTTAARVGDRCRHAAPT